MKKMRTIGFINWKGGVGKTTISCNTAYALAHHFADLRILFIDMDKQGNASYWFGANPELPNLYEIFERTATAEAVIQHTRYANIDIIPADASLLDINIEILKDQSQRQDNILKQALEPVMGDYDLCIIDNPPDSNIPVLNGITMVDDLIAVTLPNRFSVQGIMQLQSELDNYNAALGLDINILGVLINQKTAFDSEIFNLLNEKYRMLPPIRGGLNTQKWLDKVVNQRKSIYELCPQSGYARDLKKFIEKLTELIASNYTGAKVL